MADSGFDKNPWTAAEFEAQLRRLAPRYHINHPFSRLHNGGELDRAAIQGWVLNRYYYQVNIPQKDAALLANCPDREVRRQWLRRIVDHDGDGEQVGGIECWVRLGMACGLTREDIESQRQVLPGVRFAVAAYVNFVRRASWQEAVASSLTELFAPTIHRERLAEWPRHYPWIEADGLQYFRNRLTEAHRDVEHGLALTLKNFTTRDAQERVLQILQFKLDVLWSMLDAMHLAYVQKMPPYFNVSDEPAVPKPTLRIAPGMRLQWEKAQDAHVLLYPEGMVRLSDSAVTVLELCDGTRSAEDIVVELTQRYEGADLRDDVLEFIELARNKGWIVDGAANADG